jgi:hypothetical protein
MYFASSAPHEEKFQHDPPICQATGVFQLTPLTFRQSKLSALTRGVNKKVVAAKTAQMPRIPRQQTNRPLNIEDSFFKTRTVREKKTKKIDQRPSTDRNLSAIATRGTQKARSSMARKEIFSREVAATSEAQNRCFISGEIEISTSPFK